MSRLEFGDGLANHPAYLRKGIGLFFDDNFHIIEGPSKWMLRIAKIKSRSDETSTGYAQILSRYLDWLDCSGYGSQNWQSVDEDIFDEYLMYLQKERPDGRTIKAETAFYYASRIHEFYLWARRQGYEHYLDIEIREVEHKIDANRHLLSHIKSSITTGSADFNIPRAKTLLHKQEMNKFVRQADFEAALKLLDDPVFQIIAAIIRATGLRPKDLLQLPYRGKGKNADFIPYDLDDIPTDLDSTEIYYEFASKGKRRSIPFPGKLWRVICELYLPLRRKRAEIFHRKNGISPKNSTLFLTHDGLPVTYPILYYHFAKVPVLSDALPDTPYKAERFSANMLRHSYATYFVYEALKRKGRLGQSYVYDAALDQELRIMLGHTDVQTTLRFYVHLVNAFIHDDLLEDLRLSGVDSALNAILERYSAWPVSDR